MGEVWKARDSRLGHTVAIKRMNERHSARFDAEARDILLTPAGVAKLLDFGLAKQTAESDARSDLFSFGVVLYELLSAVLRDNPAPPATSASVSSS